MNKLKTYQNGYIEWIMQGNSMYIMFQSLYNYKTSKLKYKG